MRRLVIALLVTAAAPLGAQQMNHDPTNPVKGSGQLPPGWMMRFDPARVMPGRPAPAAPQPNAVSFTAEGKGFHLVSGPAAIYYNAKDVARGEFMVTAAFAQPKSMQHEAYGLFVGGSNLQDSTQSYLYFVVRPMDGGILINARSGDARPRQLVPWTTDPAVNKDDPTSGKASNVLAIRVTRDSVHFLANNKQVRALARSELAGISTDGQVGLRLNHNLDVHITGFGIQK